MADAFMAALFGAKEVNASARAKMGNGETRTVKFRGIPGDMTDEAFLEAARECGVDLSVQRKKDDERGKAMNGKGVFGAAAMSATCSVLGFTPTEDVKDKLKKRGGTVAPEPPVNANGKHDGAAAK